MARTIVCITEPFGRPKQFSDLVVFSDNRTYIPQWDTADYLNACRKYALQHQVYLVPSRFIVDDVLYLCLFGPDGSIVGVQGATHLNLSHRDKLKQYHKAEVFPTPVGNIFLCVDVDIYYPEVLRLARLLGADLVVSSQFINTYELSRQMVTTGIWNAAQSNGVYVVGCCNCFSAVAAPWEITPDQTGYLVPPAHTHSLFCKLFFNKLRHAEFGTPPRRQLNLPFIEKNLSALCRR